MPQGQRDELVLDPTVQKVVRRLLARVPGPAVLVADGEALGHVPGRVGRAPDVHDLAGVHEVVESPQGLLRIDLERRAVELVQVDAIGPQAAQRGFARTHDVPA